jgi:hypothetical protein
VVPIGTSNPNFLKPIQLKDKIRLISKKLFISKFISKDYPSHAKFETSIEFQKFKLKYSK